MQSSKLDEHRHHHPSDTVMVINMANDITDTKRSPLNKRLQEGEGEDGKNTETSQRDIKHLV
ncbi:hypothetical protein ABEB36_008904 [Hypothenemus hampei]|uniref:Uncharacterized protein n=1 Tax=Hypothenemus hampei TaxID=57062 RepID=A0ABD1ENI3_HYPHA